MPINGQFIDCFVRVDLLELLLWIVSIVSVCCCTYFHIYMNFYTPSQVILPGSYYNNHNHNNNNNNNNSNHCFLILVFSLFLIPGIYTTTGIRKIKNINNNNNNNSNASISIMKHLSSDVLITVHTNIS